jgi:hypothetical protein
VTVQSTIPDPDLALADFVWRIDALRFVARYVRNPVWSDDDTAILVSFDDALALAALAHVSPGGEYSMVPGRAEALICYLGRRVLVVAR